MKKKIYRLLALVLVLSALLSTLTTAANPDDYIIPDDWSHDALVFAVENDILRGNEDGDLLPYNHITRAEMSAVLVRLLQATEEGDISAFEDVPDNAWYYKELAIAYAAGIFGGTSPSKMSPNAKITREQAVVVLCRAFGIVSANRDAYQSFTDGAQVSDYARDSVSAMKEYGILGGYNDGSFRPRANISRAEVAQLLYKIIDVIADSPEDLPTEGWVLYRGTEPLPDDLTLDGTLILGPSSPTELMPRGWSISGNLVIRTGADTEADLRFIEAGGLVVAPQSGIIQSGFENVCLWGGGSTYTGDVSRLTVMGGNHIFKGGSEILDIRGGNLVHTGPTTEVSVPKNATLSLRGDCETVALASGAAMYLYGDCKDVTMSDNAKMSLFGNGGNITMSGNTVMTVNGSCKNVTMAGGAKLTVNGACGDVTMSDRTTLILNGDGGHIVINGSDAHVTVNGTALSITVNGEDSVIDGKGRVKELIVDGRNTQNTLAYDTLTDLWAVKQAEYDNALKTVQTMRVPCPAEKNTALYETQSLTGWICDIPKGTVVYNEWHPAGNVFYVSLADGRKGWVHRWDFYIPDDVVTTDGTLDYSEMTKEGFVDKMGYDSKTDYLVWVSRYTQKVIVYKGSKGNWDVIKTFPCSSGENNTPTPEGIFEIYNHTWRWYFDYYYVDDVSIFNGGHAFHTILMSYNGGVYDDRVGIPLSHGCVRMLPDDCNYIYNLPSGTRVVIY